MKLKEKLQMGEVVGYLYRMLLCLLDQMIHPLLLMLLKKGCRVEETPKDINIDV